MGLFVIVLDEDGIRATDPVRDRLRNRFDDTYEISPFAFLVSSKELTKDVAATAGIRGDDRIEGATGAVFRLDSYSGFTNRAMWEWISKVED